MHFEFDQVIRAPRDKILEAYCDPSFYEALASMPKLGRPELLERVVEHDAVRLKVRFAFTGEVSAAVRAVVDPEKLTWVTDTIVRPATGTIAFVVVPDHYPDRMTASGIDRFVDEGVVTRRLTTREVRVRVPIVGSSAERGIVNGYREHLAGEAELLEEWLAP